MNKYKWAKIYDREALKEVYDYDKSSCFVGVCQLGMVSKENIGSVFASTDISVYEIDELILDTSRCFIGQFFSSFPHSTTQEMENAIIKLCNLYKMSNDELKEECIKNTSDKRKKLIEEIIENYNEVDDKEELRDILFMFAMHSNNIYELKETPAPIS